MFELTIKKQQLLSPLLTVAGAIDKKQSLAILSNILLKLTDAFLVLTATDLEIEITAAVPFHSHEGKGTVTVPAKKLIDIIRSLDDDATPTLSFHNDVLTIKEGRSQFRLSTLSADDYPSNEGEQNEVEFSLVRSEIIRLFQSTHFAMSQQDVRAYLNGLLLELDSQNLTTVATDGHRMAICRQTGQLSEQHHRLVIPRKGVQEILRLLSTVSDDHINVSAGKSHFKLKTDQYSFATKLIETRFPSYGKAIPVDQDKQVIIDRDVLKRALSRIIILANEKSRAVLLHIQSGLVTLVANNQEQEEAIESMPAETEGDEIKIGINATYLLDVLNHIEEGQLQISLKNIDSSILIQSLKDNQYFYIIMPMKI